MATPTVIHDGRQCGCPNKLVCENAEAAAARWPGPRFREPSMGDMMVVARDFGAELERRRIRAAQAKALRELRSLGYHRPPWSAVARAMKTIESATRAQRRAKRSAGK